jgi:hypothetical protein
MFCTVVRGFMSILQIKLSLHAEEDNSKYVLCPMAFTTTIYS